MGHGRRPCLVLEGKVGVSQTSQGDLTGHDLAVAAFFLAWAGVGWASVLSAPNLIDSLNAGRDPGPALMPLIVLGIVSVGGLALAVRPVAQLLTGRGAIDARITPNWLLVAFFVSVAVFPGLMLAVGYAATTMIFVFAWAFLLTPEALRRPLTSFLQAAVAAVATTLVVYGGFDLVIGAQLP